MASSEPRPHALNRSFAWSVPAGPYRRISEQDARQWDEQGFFLLEGAFDAERMAEVIAEIDPIEEQMAAFLRTRPDGKLFIAEEGNITFSVNLVLRSPVLRAFCGDPVFQDLGHDLIGPDVRLYWEQAVYKKPEKPSSFPWHQDNGYTYLEPQQYVTCWVALTDATRENGCPWVVPGLHHRGTLHHEMTDAGWQCLVDPPEAIPVEAPAGSIVVFSSLTPHATGPNTTDGIRKAYIVQFAPDGACVLADGNRITQDDADRQYRILHSGEPVAA
jgi:ectoine hydroxylase-related dioxygenase (phytanoyl-CoA dioxygenase family)